MTLSTRSDLKECGVLEETGLFFGRKPKIFLSLLRVYKGIFFSKNDSAMELRGRESLYELLGPGNTGIWRQLCENTKSS